MLTETQIIAALGGVIVTLAGTLAFLYRDQAQQADARAKAAAEREDALLRPMIATLAQLSTTVGQIADAGRTVGDYVTELRIAARYQAQGQGQKETP
jgi:hypothetical protein